MLLHLGFLLLVAGNVFGDLKISTNMITVEVLHATTFEVEISNFPGDNPRKTLILVSQYDDLMVVVPGSLELDFENQVNTTQVLEIKLYTFKAGKSEIAVYVTTPLPDIKSVYNGIINVNIYESKIATILSEILGWLYFLSWSFSFYPQIYTNYMRKSVGGLSFDFVAYSLIGYVTYNLFNIGMYFVPTIKHEYAQRNPRSVNPVHGSDLLFSLHSLLATTATMFQCLRYRNDGEKISTFTNIVIGIDTLATIIFLMLASLNITLWLTVLYMCSYFKLFITFLKYIPQVNMNYKRKTTEGWSTTSVVLDLVGGVFCIFQMMIDGYNYADWKIIFENPTKFGLSLISVFFDVIFLIQHHIFDNIASKVNDIDLPQTTNDA